jgi:TM2 domain-containing membrane protein YozV
MSFLKNIELGGKPLHSARPKQFSPLHQESREMTDLPPAARQRSNQRSGLSDDARALMLYEANKKTALVAYLLWLFLGLLGAHNFCLGRTGVAVAQLILSLTVVGLVITVVWVLVDAFLIPGWIRQRNNILAAQLGAQPEYPSGVGAHVKPRHVFTAFLRMLGSS